MGDELSAGVGWQSVHLSESLANKYSRVWTWMHNRSMLARSSSPQHQSRVGGQSQTLFGGSGLSAQVEHLLPARRLLSVESELASEMAYLQIRLSTCSSSSRLSRLG